MNRLFFGIGDQLADMRRKQGKTQKQVAKSMRCTQSKVSKLETAKDDIDIRDLSNYLFALGKELKFDFVDKETR